MTRRSGHKVAMKQRAVAQAVYESQNRRFRVQEQQFIVGQLVQLNNGAVKKVSGIGHLGDILEGMSGEFPASVLKSADPP